MNRLIITFIAIFVSTAAACADNWCESLIKRLNTASDIDKTLRATRNPQSHQLVSAVYDYKFSSDSLFKAIRNDLRLHADEADFFSESGSAMVIMRLTLDGFRWDCKLQRLDKDKQFLVTVNKSGQSMQQQTQPAPAKKQPGSRSQHKRPQSTQDKTAVEQNNLEIEKAERERREKLGL
ncbi:MAG: hypothetical protein NC102_00575 [Clostridium sp.]|nr:hypothetical protein [Clostridium sp.]